MEVFINNKELAIAASRIAGATSERSMAQIGIKVSDGELTFFANDTMLAIYCTLPCEVKKPGDIFIPAKLFLEVVRELPNGDIHFVTDAAWLNIKGGPSESYSVKLPLISELSWREAPNLKTSNRCQIPASKLYYMIQQVQFSIAYDSPRNFGNVGYLQKSKDGTLRLVGTDSFRLSYSEADVSLGSQFLESGVCLSKRALAELGRIASEGSEFVDIAISPDGSTLLAEIPNCKMFIRLSSVKYPNYQNVFPSKQLNSVNINRATLQAVTKRVLITADKSRALQLRFSPSSLTISSRTVGKTEGKEDLDLQDYQGESRNLAVNGKFFSDVFSTTSSDTLTLKFDSEDDPIVITPNVEPDGCKSMHVLVPIKDSH
ncbi:MAG: DNA polymerase III subunit beta [Bdellovibrionota bacterium]